MKPRVLFQVRCLTPTVSLISDLVYTDHVGLTNDFFSYLKEKLTNSDDTNIIRILMDHENLTYEEAKTAIEKKIRQKEQDFIPAGMAVLNDPVLGKDPEVQRWIANLPYCMGGNNAWSQEVRALAYPVLLPCLTMTTAPEWSLQRWEHRRRGFFPFPQLRGGGDTRGRSCR